MNTEELKRRTKEFAHRCVKLAITLPETDLIDENLLKKEFVEPLLKEAQELTAIFVASRKTARNNI